MRRREGAVDAVECKINPDRLNLKPIRAFRRIHPNGANYVATPLDRKPYQIRRGELVLTVCSTRDLP